MDLDNLKRRIDLVERDSKISPALLAHFADWVRSADDEELFKVDVLMWAEAHQIPVDDALDLFLHAARAGIFEMSWGVICPFCGSTDTVLESSFGPTLCRSTHFCRSCRNPFESFKPKARPAR